MTVRWTRVLMCVGVALGLVACSDDLGSQSGPPVTREARGGIWSGALYADPTLIDKVPGLADEWSDWLATTIPPPPTINGCTLAPHSRCPYWDLTNSDLRSVNLDSAYLFAASLSWSDLSNANLFGVNFENAQLRGANLSNANLKWSGLMANLIEANLSGAQIIEANLTKAALGRANLSGANLTGSNFSYADMWAANMSAATIKDACFAGTSFYNTTMPDGSVRSTYDAAQWLLANGARVDC